MKNIIHHPKRAQKRKKNDEALNQVRLELSLNLKKNYGYTDENYQKQSKLIKEIEARKKELINLRLQYNIQAFVAGKPFRFRDHEGGFPTLQDFEGKMSKEQLESYSKILEAVNSEKTQAKSIGNAFRTLSILGIPKKNNYFLLHGKDQQPEIINAIINGTACNDITPHTNTLDIKKGTVTINDLTHNLHGEFKLSELKPTDIDFTHIEEEKNKSTNIASNIAKTNNNSRLDSNSLTTTVKQSMVQSIQPQDIRSKPRISQEQQKQLRDAISATRSIINGKNKSSHSR